MDNNDADDIDNNNPVRHHTSRYRRVLVPNLSTYVHGCNCQPNLQVVIDELDDDEHIVSVYPISSLRVKNLSGELYYVPILEALIIKRHPPLVTHHHCAAPVPDLLVSLEAFKAKS